MKFSEAAFSLYQASLSPLFVVRKVKDTSQRHIGAVTTALLSAVMIGLKSYGSMNQMFCVCVSDSCAGVLCSSSIRCVALMCILYGAR